MQSCAVCMQKTLVSRERSGSRSTSAAPATPTKKSTSTEITNDRPKPTPRCISNFYQLTGAWLELSAFNIVL